MNTLRQGCTTLFTEGVLHPSLKVYYTLIQWYYTRFVNPQIVH
ncbi:hypothetical protein HMPREF9140_01198 [Prevotella micans F0438]|uniref:Uncharacterized protein n=1 Tax=Prevotella micans F0438 TaxID=883158 RepID=H1Q2R0_9BACT|nr:hypothetical protein HMPREF9140_01198 [Prevotella micans F0438]